MRIKSSLLLVGALCLSSALASDFVSESNLTGVQLPKGALELTDDDFSEDMVELLEGVAGTVKGKCEYHELLYWEGDSAAIVKSLNAQISKGFTFKDLGSTKMDDGSIFQQFVMSTSKVQYAGVWFPGKKDVMLAWCSVKK